MDAERLYFSLRNLVDTMPDLRGEVTTEVLTWLGRAAAIVDTAGNAVEAASFRTAMDTVITENIAVRHERGVGTVSSILYRTLAKAELDAPAGQQGSFIAAGSAFDALTAVAKVFDSATSSLLIVDPYADEKLLSDFLPLARESAKIQVLTDERTVKPSFKPAVQRWRSQYNDTRPLDARLTPPRQLHDRLIIVDDRDVWIITQSFNALAERSPASLSKFQSDSAQLKLESYRAIWTTSTPIS